MRYTLKHKDFNIALFEPQNRMVKNVELIKQNIERLPFSLKGILLNKSEFVRKEDDFRYILNEDGSEIFSEWLSDRAIPIERYRFQKEQYGKKNNVEWLLSNHSLSFTDCYWTETETENFRWDDIKLNPAELSQYIAIDGDLDATKIRLHKSNSSLGGQLDKYWFTDENKNLYLHKVTDDYHEILSIRECFAAEIYRRQGISHVDYELTYKKNNISGCNCKAFTDENTELIPMCDFLEGYKVFQLEDSYNLIAELGSINGLDKQQIYDYLDAQTIVDYLITNRDRHYTNFGFLRDSDTLRFIGTAPIFDSGNSISREEAASEDVENTTVSGMYNTETENLKRVRNFNIIHLSLLPSQEEYRSFLDRGYIISDIRKAGICSLYGKKIEYIRELQKQHKPYNMEYEYTAKENVIRALIYKETGDIRISFDNNDGHNILFKHKDEVAILNIENCSITGDLGEYKELITQSIEKCGIKLSYYGKGTEEQKEDDSLDER